MTCKVEYNFFYFYGHLNFFFLNYLSVLFLLLIWTYLCFSKALFITCCKFPLCWLIPLTLSHGNYWWHLRWNFMWFDISIFHFSFSLMKPKVSIPTFHLQLSIPRSVRYMLIFSNTYYLIFCLALWSNFNSFLYIMYDLFFWRGTLLS